MKLVSNILNIKENNQYNGLAEEINILIIKEKYETSKENILVVANSLFEANLLFEKLKNYIDLVFLFPMDDFITSMIIAASPELKITRLETLNAINNGEHCVIVTNLYGFLHKLPVKNSQDEVIKIAINSSLSRDELIEKINNYGYTRSSLTTSTGEYSVRGYIVDIFLINHSHPTRIEFFGDNVDAIREFDENTQLSIKSIKDEIITPFDEVTSITTNSLIEYLNNPAIYIFNEEQLKVAYEKLLDDIAKYQTESNIECVNYPIYKYDDIATGNLIKINSLNSDNLYHSQNIINFNSNFDTMETFVKKNLYQGKTIIFCLTSDNEINKIKEIFFDEIIINDFSDYAKNKINIIKQKINNGFIINDFVIISDNDIEKKYISTVKYKNNIKIGKRIGSFDQLNVGDYIVHQMHGIGIYNGLVSITKNGIKQDYIQLIYKDKDKIYIQIDKINTLFKYTPKDGATPKLNKLSSTDWEKKKLQVRNKINDISNELINLYSQRNQTISFVYKDFPEEDSFASEFEFTPTEDQKKVINEINSDLKKSKPMDRLLCGDVGYGKTEVAFRTMFKAVLNGFQVSYLCPTTILAKQQYLSALDRFKNYPINIALLSRFTSTKETKKIISQLELGKIDILFGTHKLFNSEVKYKNLGLLVVDEEQRFGVIHKEKIKEMKNNINVLTLSATPIPRTMKMAMSGLRDLSIIDTPPINRYPVQTYVVLENELLVRDAIYKELSRKGQIFYLYNNVANIIEEVNRIKKLVPEARIEYAHGQMSKYELEEIMQRFVDFDFDILICTTIIESGIDISNANTLIIKDADNFGLSQLYQIRGRVGRSDRIAYAYLLYKKSKILTETALQRLKAIQEFTELGSGYRIAMRDLAIRGAGDILGSEQAGFIDSIGIDLFLKMINEKVLEINGEEVEKEEEIPNLVHVDNHIDEMYASDQDIIIEIHQKISEIDSYDKLLEIRKELEDRFGNVDEKLNIYMYQKLFEKKAKKVGIIQVNQLDNVIEIVLSEKLSRSIKGDKLFLELSNIDPSITIKYQYKKFFITLYPRKYKKHYIYYLIKIVDLLEKKD